MAELLLELFSEEIPARMQAQACENLEREVSTRLGEAGYNGFGTRSFATPRRITLVVDGLDAASPDRREERKGPRVGAPDKALEGFLRSTGLTKDQLQTESDKKGAYYVAVIEQHGKPTADVIAEIVPDVVRSFHWPKSMRWGAGSLRWVRPLHSILCLFDGAVVPFEVDHIQSGDTTRGHRFMTPDAFSVTSFEDYAHKLKDAFVLLDPQGRQGIILAEAKRLAEAEGYELVEDQALIAETAGLVEWPVVLMGGIDEGFVKPIDQGGLPPEVLTTSMAKHQKYFSVRDPKTGGLAPRFIVVSNLVAEDNGAKIVAGNERVLRARLSDAKFFWDQDRKVKLEDRVDSLKDIIFHAKLGTVREKVKSVEQITAHVVQQISDASVTDAMRAATLAKADLTSEMVGEFADLQGLMGRYYATADGEKPEVAAAIQEHYSPLGPSDACPSDLVSVAVAIADKAYSLVGFFGIDEKPTGSKDPYALRRAALGIIRLVLENNLRLRLRSLFFEVAVRFNERGGFAMGDNAVNPLIAFFADRLKVYLKDQGIKYDLIDSVFALEGQDDLVLIVARVNALKDFLGTDDGANLLTAYKRAANILRIEEKKDNTSYREKADASQFIAAEEKTLYDAITKAVPAAMDAVAAEDFARAMGEMANLRGPVDAFFDKVTVNAEEVEVRKNRLHLLSEIVTALGSVADFSKLEG